MARRWSRSVTVGQVIAAVGVVMIVVSIVLHWIDGTVGTRHDTVSGSGVPVHFLWDYTTNAKDPTLLVVLIPIAVAGAAGIVVRRLDVLVTLAGAAAMAAAALYAFQLHQALGSIPLGVGRPTLTDVLGVAPVVCFVGGLVLEIAMLFPKRA